MHPFVLRLLFIFLCATTLSAEVVRADAITDYNLALQFYNQGRWDLAAQGCRDFLKNYPGHEQSPLAQLYLAQALVHQQQFALARDEFRAFLKNYPKHKEEPLAMYRQGECSYFLGENEQASAELNAFLQAYGDHELAEWGWVYLGESEFRRNAMPAAATAFETYRSKYATGTLLDDAEFGLARVYEVLGKKPEAVALYRGIADRPNSPRAPESQFNLGARLYDQGEFANAAEAFMLVAKKFPVSSLISNAEMNAGYAFYQLQKYPEAIARFQVAAADPTEKLTAGYWVGLSYKAAGDLEQASQTFANTIAGNEDSPLAEAIYFHWGHSELRGGHFDAATAQFSKVYQTWPKANLADDALYAACEATLRAGQLEQTDQLNQLFEQQYAESGLRFAQKLLLARLRIAQADKANPEQQTPLLEQAVAAATSVVQESQLKETSVSARLQWARALDALGRAADIPQVVQPILTDPADVHPLDLEAARLLHGKASLTTGEYAVAAEDFAAVLSQSNITDRPAALAGLIVALAETKQWPATGQRLQELKTLDPQDVQFSQLSTRAGDVAFAAAAWPEAAAFFSQVVALGSGSKYYIAAMSGLGHTQYEQKDYPASATSFQQVLASGTPNQVLLSDAIHLRALCLRLAGDQAAAVLLYEEGAKTFRLPEGVTTPTPEQLELSRNAYRCAKGGARAARELKQSEKSDEFYTLALRELKLLPPEEQLELPALINEWAEMHYLAENFVRSDELYALLVKEAPESDLADDAGLILAESLRFSEKLPEATAAFQALLANAKADPLVRQRVLIHLLDLYAKAGDWKQVEATAATMRSEFPANEHADYVTYRLGEAKLKAGEQDAALKILDDLRQDLALRIEQAPEWWPEVWLLLAETYLSRKEYANVEGTLNDLQQRAPNSPLLYRGDLVLGQRLENTAEWDKSRAAYERVLAAPAAKQTEAAAEAQFRIAETYMKQKNYPAAFIAYYKVVVGPPFPEWQSYALFQAGMCDKMQRNWKGAATSFSKLIEDFPNSDSASQAAAQLKEIQPFLKP